MKIFLKILVIIEVFTLQCLSSYGQTISIQKTPQGLAQIRWQSVPQASHYRVEYRDKLSGDVWKAVPLQDRWVIGGTSFVDVFSMTNQARFYRLVAITATRGVLSYSTMLQQLTKAQLTALFVSNGIPVSPQYDVKVYRIYYDTVAPDGLPIKASGAVVIPVASGKSFPLLSYQHGTEFLTNNVASQGGGEFVAGLALASLGYAVSMPDYLGMGLAVGMLHPFVHARSEATACIDALRAVRVLCSQTGVSLNGQLFLIGYSQGGHATMALHREIEFYHTNEFVVTASAPMAGPYDMSGTMANLMLSDAAYDTPAYLPYTLFSYNNVYKIYDSSSNFLNAPYASTLPPLFDGRHSASQINSAMPSIPSRILKQEFLNQFKSTPNHPFRIALQANDLYNWKPIALMQMYHCASDVTVPFSNSEVALARFHALGATHVELVDPNPWGNHGTGAISCFYAAYQWFETLKQ
ncbi:MAG: hypothetical protein N2487_00520 [Verrucomicrobiae bacterium]|nr:hypothetical protein [Verrucomicrobiae bacterium]